jgi:hypothetical protein
MAVSDFGISQLSTDALAISGPTGTGGEAFVYASTTYYGVFSEVNRDLMMDTVGFKDERQTVLVFPRASLTAGITVNDYLFRPFDSTTYQAVKGNPDLQWHEVTLRRPFDTT